MIFFNGPQHFSTEKKHALKLKISTPIYVVSQYML